MSDGAYRVSRAELDASPDRPDTAPDFRKVHHFRYERHDRPGDALPMLALAVGLPWLLLFLLLTVQ